MIMEIIKAKNDTDLGNKAAKLAADYLKQAIKEKDKARLLLATGASQLTTINELVKQDVNWEKVEVFHLDEYIGISKKHKASFQRYIKERFADKLNLKKTHFIDGEGDVQEDIKKLTKEISSSPIDVGLIGIGENAHIAFNDPPADFHTEDSFIRVNLDNTARQQQVNEGWFDSIEEVPKEAITMSVHQIMQCENIISCVPYKSKAQAVKNTIESEITNDIPATILKKHRSWSLFLDLDSSSLL